MNARLLIAVFCLCTSMSSFAQTPKPFYSIESPNSAALKGALESPVTLNTGKVGVTIPIYTVQQKGINVPIALSYNSGGVKLDLHPGWVGSNWSLQAGGVITRNIKGVPDELYWRNDFVFTDSENSSGSQTIPYGYAYNYSLNSVSDWNSLQRITDLAKAGMEPNTLWVEGEPDEFVFKCGKYAGKFYIDHTGHIRVQGHPEIKVDMTIVYNIPLFDASKPLNANDPGTYTSVNVATYVNDYPIYSYNRIRKAVLMGFKITTPDGLQYEYGMYGQNYDPNDTFDEVEFTAGIFNQYNFDDIFTTWRLKKIIAPNNEFVEFIYERGSPILQLGSSFSFYKAGGEAPAKGFLGFIFGGPSSYTQEAKQELNGRFIRPTYLKKIVSKSSVVEFTRSETNELKYDYETIVWQILDRSRFYDENYYCPLFGRLMLGIVYPNETNIPPGIISYGNNEYSVVRHDGMIEDLYFNNLKWYKLDKITVSSRHDNSIINEWLFDYNNVPTERLRLLSLRERGKNNSALPPYIFKYNLSKDLPAYNSFLIDHWGYYNGRLAQVDISSETSLQNYKSLRGSVEEYLYAGTLTQVMTPTGGTKQFIYEPNQYSAVVKRDAVTGEFYVDPLSGGTKIGGGLRIHKIIEAFGGASPDVTTTYIYGDGILLGDVQYYWPNYKGKLLNGNEYTSTRFVTESLLPISENPGGGIVAYETVTEKKTGNGRKIYQYTNFALNPDENGVSIDPQKSPYSPFTSRGFERGLLKAVYTYDELDPAKLLASEVYEYNSNPGFSGDFIRAVEARGIRLFGTNEVNEIQGTAYKHYLHPFQITSKTTKVLDRNSGTYIIRVEEYIFDTDPVPNNDNQLKEVKVIDSSERSLKTVYKHPMDFQVNDGIAELSGLNALKSSNILEQVVSKEELIKPVDQMQYLTKSYSLNVFNKTTQGYPVLKDVYEFKIPAPAISNNTIIDGSTFSLDSRMSLEISFDKYDNHGNLLQYTGKDGVPVTVLYGYNHTNVVARVKNATYEQVLSILGQTLIDQLNSNPGTAEDLRLKLQPLFNSPLLDKCYITIYTYDPLVGITSETDSNGRVTFYQYDDLGRLKLIKDHEDNIIKRYSYQYKVK